MSVVVLISHSKGMFIAIVRGINCNDELLFVITSYSPNNVSSFVDSVLKFSTRIDIFIDTAKTEFSHVLIDRPVQCFAVKQILCKIIVHGV